MVVVPVVMPMVVVMVVVAARGPWLGWGFKATRARPGAKLQVLVAQVAVARGPVVVAAARLAVMVVVPLAGGVRLVVHQATSA